MLKVPFKMLPHDQDKKQMLSGGFIYLFIYENCIPNRIMFYQMTITFRSSVSDLWAYLFSCHVRQHMHHCAPLLMSLKCYLENGTRSGIGKGTETPFSCALNVVLLVPPCQCMCVCVFVWQCECRGLWIVSCALVCRISGLVQDLMLFKFFCLVHFLLMNVLCVLHVGGLAFSQGVFVLLPLLAPQHR